MVYVGSGLYWLRPGGKWQYSWFNLVPLLSSNVEVTIVDQITQVDITQTYVNNQSFNLEGSYIFPLDERAAVCGFEAEVAGNRIVGEAKEKEQAKREYIDAVSRGDGAYLLEEKKADVFKVKVGNIPSGEKVTIKITYVAELKCEIGEMVKRFLLPTSVAPRYSPQSSEQQSEADQDFEQPMADSGCGCDLNVRMKVVMLSDIVSIDSPTHEITQSIEGSTATVGLNLTLTSTPLDKDIVVNIVVSQPHIPRVCVEECDGSFAAMVTLFPHINFRDIPVEIIFVIDRSGSMGGGRINAVREAMQMFMRALPEDCYFDIIGFGSIFESLFSDSKRYDDESLLAATQYIKKMDADLGGTELVRPLTSAFNRPSKPGYSRQVFVLTDGEVSNTDEVISLVSSHSGKSRVFSLGVGESVSHHLVEGIARAGKGTSQFVRKAGGGNDMSVKVMKQLREATQPALQNVRVDWGESHDDPSPLSGSSSSSLRVCHAPCEVPPIFDSQHFLLYAIYSEHSLPSSVTITAESPDGPLSVTLPVDSSKKIVGKVIHTLASRAMIRDLEEGRSWMTKLGIDDKALVKAEIIRLGTKYQLASLYTSFIAVEVRTGKRHDCGVSQQIEEADALFFPMSRTLSFRNSSRGRGRGRGGSGHVGEGFNFVPGLKRKRSVDRDRERCPSPVESVFEFCADVDDKDCSMQEEVSVQEKSKSKKRAREKSSKEFLPILMSATLDESQVSFGVPCASSSSSSPLCHATSSSPSSPVEVIMEQSVNGSFALTSRLSSLIGISVEKLKEVLVDLKLGHGSVVEKIIATAAVLMFLEKKFGNQRNVWDLNANKAKRFIEKQGPSKPLSEILQALSVLF